MDATTTIKNLTTDNCFCKKDLRIPRLRYFCHDGVVSVLFAPFKISNPFSLLSVRLKLRYQIGLLWRLPDASNPAARPELITLPKRSPSWVFYLKEHNFPLSSSTYQVSLMSPPNISLDHLLSIFSNPIYSKLPSTSQPDLQLLHLPPSNPCFTTSFSAFLKV